MKRRKPAINCHRFKATVAAVLSMSATAHADNAPVTSSSTPAAQAIEQPASVSAVPVAVPGGIYALALPEGVTGVRYRKRDAYIYNGTALIGISLKASVGTHELTLTRADGSEQRLFFDVADKNYPEQRITLANPNMVSPPPETLKRIREESAKMASAYRRYTPVEESPVPFVQPLDGIMSSPFGRKRFFNDQPRNPHSGIDLAADTGTPIASPSGGVIALTGEFYFNGKSVFVDHGGGMISMMCHMSEILVAQGDKVSRGDTLGLVGATGRATGPHLHWTVKLNGNAVDPVTLMALFAPTPPTTSIDTPLSEPTESPSPGS
ncbi:MAG: M23 family metallopeptidase [Pseudomonadaceae bacterium]|nr:M23 family metallopeptidase [Pseudomonadaceae bacterium]